MEHVQSDTDTPAGRPAAGEPEAARQRRRDRLTKFMMTVAALEFGVSVGSFLGNSLS